MAERYLKALPSGNGHRPSNSEPDPAETIQPNSPEAEEAVLGSILINHHLIHDLKSWLRPEYFWTARNGWIYEAMLSIAERNEEIDSFILAEELRMRNQLDAVGGIPYLVSLTNHTPTYIHFDTYARIVKEAWRRRRTLGLAAEIAKCALSADGSGAESLKAKRLIDELRELMAQPYDPQADGLTKDLIDAKDLEKLPDVSWLVKGEIPDRGLTIVFGPSGVGKSFFVLDYALSLSHEHTGLYVAAEGESGFKRRVRAWTYHHKKAPGNLKFYMNVAALLSPSERNAFQSQIIERVKPKYIIFDTFAHCMLPGDENSARDMGMFLRAAKEIQKEYDCAVILVHHTNKEGQIERGSGSMRGAADSMIRLTSEDDIIAVECSKTKDEKPFPTRYIKLLPVMVDQDDDSGDLLYSPVVIAAEKVEQQASDPATNQQRKILETIIDVFEYGAPVTELSETTHINRGSLHRSLSRMKRLGWLDQEDKGAPYKITDEGRAAVGRSPMLTHAAHADSDADSNADSDSWLNQSDAAHADSESSISGEQTSEISEAAESAHAASKAQSQKRNAASKAASSQHESASKRRKKLTAEAQQKIADGICPVCDQPLEQTRKGNQCPDCKAVWSH